MNAQAGITEKAKPGPKDTIKKVRENLDSVVEKTDNALKTTNDALGELRVAMEEQSKKAAERDEEMNATNQAILKFMERQTLAINNPVVLNTNRFEADEQDLGEVADIGDSIIQTGRFDIDSPEFQDKDRIEKFMHEKVTVHIHENSSDLEVGAFAISVNGKKEIFRFGEVKTIERKFVEGLARARPETYNNKKITLQTNTGEVASYANEGARSLRYPFSIERDDNPVGRSWYNLVLRQS